MSFFSPLFSMLECGYAINDKEMNVKRLKKRKIKEKTSGFRVCYYVLYMRIACWSSYIVIELRSVS